MITNDFADLNFAENIQDLDTVTSNVFGDP